MPEGPEIRRAADRIAAAIAGKTTEEVWFAHDVLEPWGPELTGRRVKTVEARGKALLVRFEGDVSVYAHSQLYGRWYVMKAGQEPRTNRTLRLAIHVPKSSALLYSASEIAVLDDEDLDAHPYLAKLGPDVLDSRVRSRTVLSRLGNDRFIRRSLGSLYLDQSFLAGVGNYLRSEILFVAGLDPSRRPKDLTDDERRELAKASLKVCRQSYQTGGITNDPAIVRELKEAGWTRRAYRHFVFSRDGAECHRCGEIIVKQETAGRRLYLCPGCQR
ncbi:MAG: endonuclease VIII [Acidobacteriota bacterium]